MEKSLAWIYLLGLGIIVVQILILLWAQRAIPPKDILNKYTKLDVFRSRLPFIESWKEHINLEDQLQFYKYRERLFLAQAMMILNITLMILIVHVWLTYRNT
mgnify:CR=1 FL=1